MKYKFHNQKSDIGNAEMSDKQKRKANKEYRDMRKNRRLVFQEKAD